jgi:lysophospholipase L1-like esterase
VSSKKTGGGWSLRKLFAVFFALSVLGTSTPLQAVEYIEAYGDSITAGFMSHTGVTHPPPLKELSLIISDLAMYLMTGNASYVAKQHAPELSWVSVLARRIDPKGPLNLDNHAVSSSKAWQILGQVRRHPNRNAIARAFFFIGHNDLCNTMEEPKAIGLEFEAELDRALIEWDQTHSDSTAYLLPVSDIHRVYSRLSGVVWYNGAQTRYTCDDAWTKFFPYCPSHYAKHKAGTLESFMKPRLREMNNALSRLANKRTAASARNSFHFLKQAHDIAYEPEYFAVDCFHLSKKGQETIAQRVESSVLDYEQP